jgi:hypothetical protein
MKWAGLAVMWFRPVIFSPPTRTFGQFIPSEGFERRHDRVNFVSLDAISPVASFPASSR